MTQAALSPAEKAQPAMSPAALSPQVPMVTAGSHGNTSVLLAQEDMAIFEQLRYQLIVWLRIQAVRSGMDISNQGPLQLLELLRKQDNCDEPHLQIVSTLLNLANQVIKNGQAGQFDYKQALMFHLMHTKR
jgi:hypothetical protein